MSQRYRPEDSLALERTAKESQGQVGTLSGTSAIQVTRLTSYSSISGKGSTSGGGSRPRSSISAMTAATRSLMSSCSSRVLRIIRWVRVSYGASMVSRSLCADDAGLVLAQVQLDVVGEPRVACERLRDRLALLVGDKLRSKTHV